MDTVVTEKGTVLPLVNLKGKSYLMVAHRLQWLDEKYKHYTVNTEFLLVTDEQTVARATVTLYDDTGKMTRMATATKRETKKDFSDHTEKAETSAIGRALSILGLGTQHALADLEEGMRLADSPLPAPPKRVVENTAPPKPTPVARTTEEKDVPMVAVPQAVKDALPPAPKANSFRKPKAVPTGSPHAPNADDNGWS